MRRLSFLVLLLFARLAVASIPADGRIASVTVHPDRAEVTREADVRLPAGESQVEFGNLPATLDRDSLRVGGSGLAAIIGAVEVRVVVQEATRSPELEAAETELERLDAELARLNSDQATDTTLRAYYDSLVAAGASGQSEANAALKPDASALARMVAFLEEGYARLAQRQLERQPRMVAVNERIELAREKVAAARTAGSTTSRSAIVDVDSPSPGILHMSLSYVVPGARWRPTYRASLDAGGKEVELVSEAVVTQATGEDWEDVDLTLSTAEPAKGLESPYLSSWTLAPAQLQPAFTYYDRADAVNGGVAANALSEMTETIEVASGATRRKARQSRDAVVAAPLPAPVVAAAHQVVFEVPGSSDVASDQAEHRIALRTDTLPVELAYRVVASVKPEAFALAIGKAPDDRPLLGGPVRVTAGGTLLGSFALADTGPGAELRIPMGSDSRIVVKRVELPRTRSGGGSSRDNQVSVSVRTSVENTRDVPVKVDVEERLPVAQDARIVVKQGPKTTEGSKAIDERPGVLNWVLELAPREKREVQLDYTVRWPKDVVLPGL